MTENPNPFNGKDITDARIARADMTGAHLDAVRLDNSRLQVQMRNAYWSDSTLHGCRFEDVDLSHTMFEDVTLADAQIANADLSRLRITDANLTGMQIDQADLTDMRIDGVLVTDLFAAYRARRAQSD